MIKKWYWIRLFLSALMMLCCTHAWSMDFIKKRIATVKQAIHDRERDKLHKELFTAAKNFDLKRLQGLLENPIVDVNIQDVDGNTALHMAASRLPEYNNDGADCVDLLTSRKANVNTQNNVGDTPLHVAACAAPWSIINKLAEKGACLAAVNNARETVLHHAITSHNGGAVDQLIALKADPNQPSGNQDTPPLCVALERHNASYQLYVCDGMFPLIVDKNIESLLKAGARINICGIYDLKCETHPYILREVYGPLVAAIKNNNPSEVTRYLDQGACKCLDFENVPRVAMSIGEELYNAKYPLNVATNCPDPHTEMVCFLMDAGCLGSVAFGILRNAFTHGELEMAHLLISHIPKHNIKRSWNRVALPLLLYFKRLPQKLPADVNKIICSYCVRSACIAEQAENCRALFRTKDFEFERLGSSEAARNSAYEQVYTHILDNVPAWQKQIDHAILNRPMPKKIDSNIEEAKK